MNKKKAQVLDYEEEKKKRLDREVAHLSRYLAPLQGATILSVYAVKERALGEVWPVLIVRTKDGRDLQLEISCDPEGNGPGFLAGITPKKKRV